MSRREHTKDLVCCVCGQEIDEKHLLYVHKVGTKSDFNILHGDCIDKYTKKRKGTSKKSK
jgi:hypothetical protein